MENNFLEETIMNLIKPQTGKIMVCSNCGNIIAKLKENEKEFDILNYTWTCPLCKITWFESDYWKIIGNILIPFR